MLLKRLSGAALPYLLTRENHADEIEVVFRDVKLPDDNGLNMLCRLKEKTTARGNSDDCLGYDTGLRKGREAGAFDYLTKGDSDDQLLITVARVYEKDRLRKRVAELEKQMEIKYGLDVISGDAPVLKQAKDLAARVSGNRFKVLLEGETGVGKELLQVIHSASPRHTKPFVAANCSAFPKDLLESEMFGYKRGAFTGAVTNKKCVLS